MSSPQKIRIKELNPDLIPPSTKNMHNPSQGGSKIVVIGKPGCFKAGTPILMFSGHIKKVENVVKGDILMGDDNKPREVLELCRNIDEMYDIVSLQGEKYTVNKMHKLVLINKRGKISEVTIDECLKKPASFFKEYQIYRRKIEFCEKDTLIDPYEYGLNLALNISSLSKIESEYKINSLSKRNQLLAGIFDNGGNKELNSIVFKCISKKLAEDIVFVSRSVGLIAKYHKEITNLEETVYYNIYVSNISGDFSQIPFQQLEIGNTKNTGNTSKIYGKSSFKIIPKGVGKYFGFTINGNHRFLLGTFDVVRNTGKTTLITSLLYAKKHIFPVGMVMSGTEDSNGHYRKIFPSTFVYNKLNENQVENFVKRQKIAKKHLPNPWGVLLLDDCTDDPKLFNKPLFQGLYKNGRHWKMWYILSLQYCMDIKPVIRTNIDGTFILREPSLKNRRALWENYAGIIPDFSSFCEIMDQITDDYTALYIHNATQSNRLEDCVFWYKAPKNMPNGFKMGCSDFWTFHNERYDQNYVDPIM